MKKPNNVSAFLVGYPKDWGFGSVEAARNHAKKVISALDEVKKAQQGKKSPKSFDDFLKKV